CRSSWSAVVTSAPATPPPTATAASASPASALRPTPFTPNRLDRLCPNGVAFSGTNPRSTGLLPGGGGGGVAPANGGAANTAVPVPAFSPAEAVSVAPVAFAVPGPPGGACPEGAVAGGEGAPPLGARNSPLTGGTGPNWVHPRRPSSAVFPVSASGVFRAVASGAIVRASSTWSASAFRPAVRSVSCDVLITVPHQPLQPDSAPVSKECMRGGKPRLRG